MIKNRFIYSFILCNSVAFYLYIGFFTYYLTIIEFDPLSISILIGSTTLSNIFFGPKVGRFIDKTKNKFLLLFSSQIISGFIVLLFSFTANINYFFPTLSLVILFSIFLSLNSIITTQYLVPLLHCNYDLAYSAYSRSTSIALVIVSLFLAMYYDRLPEYSFFWLSAILYCCSAICLIPFIRQSVKSEENHQQLEKPNVFPFLKKHLLIVIPICCVAFTESSFNVNFEVIAFSLKTTPLFIIFLFGLVSGILDWITSYLYPKYISPLAEQNKWYIFIFGFTAIFFVATIFEYIQLSKTVWFLPILAILLEIMGIAWGIFIATKVRNISSEGNYGQIMAIFRIPRAMITFLGIVGIGAILNQQVLWLSFFINTLLLMLTGIFLIYHIKHSRR